VVVWNRARSRSGGKWCTLDSRGLYKQVVTRSEIYDGVLEVLLTGATRRRPGGGRRPAEGSLKVEAEGITGALLAELS